MSDEPHPSGGMSPLDPTIADTSSSGTPSALREASSAERVGPRPVALVEGSGPRLTGETASLLRGRLRVAAVVLFAGFATFLVKSSLMLDSPRSGAAFLFSFHAAVTVVLGLVAVMACRRCEMKLGSLRMIELIVFGAPAALFLAAQHFSTLQCCDENQYFEFRGGPWLLLIFTYALFIPNTWRRAGVVIGLMASLPVVMVIWMLIRHAALREVATADQILNYPLVMLVAWTGSVVGVHTIGTLRREAFEARRLGQYRLKRRIGAGGMGEVYLAEHQLLSRPCAVKLIHPGKANDPRQLARFQREVHATAKLSHWNTIDIYDYGSTADGTFYYVMEYLPGMSLAELVERYGPMPPERVICLLRQACGALREAHDAHLIHRDIKPGNIFAAYRGGMYDVVKVLDFGLVKPMLEEDDPQLTHDGVIAGSPLFMSPEQAVGDGEPDGRSDLYSLGAVGYYLLTGQPPFEGDKPIRVMLAHAQKEVTPPSQHRTDVPADLERVILRCLAKSPDDRFPTAESMARALAECDGAEAWSRAEAAAWWRQRKVTPEPHREEVERV